MSDYAQFADPNFNAHQYVHSILAKTNDQAGEYKTDPDLAKEDIAITISRLDHGVEDVGRQLKHVVSENHEALLRKAASVSDLEGSVKSIRKGLDELNFSLDKLVLLIGFVRTRLTGRSTGSVKRSIPLTGHSRRILQGYVAFS